MNVYDYLIHAGEQDASKVAIEFAGQKIPYGGLADQALKAAAGLGRAGIGPGQSIGLMLPNIPQFVSSLFGAFIHGNVVVPMNVLLTPPEIRYLVEDSDIRMIIVYEMFLPNVLGAIRGMERPPKIVVIGRDAQGQIPFGALTDHGERAAPRPATAETHVMTIYTSGTTGKPKGAVLSNGNVIAQLNMTEEIFALEPNDRFLCVLPLFHVFALNAVLISTIRNRGTVVLHPKFDAEAAFKSLAEDGITQFAGVPTMYFYLLKHPEAARTKFSTVRYCITGGAAMPVEVLKSFEETFGAPVYEGYGLTETTVSVCCNQPGGSRKIGSVGRPYNGVEMKVVDDDGREVAVGSLGEIIMRGGNIMQGYLNKPEATAESIKDGWFYSGDIGHRDEDGFFYIVDRKKDMIIKGGYNIYPREIEEVIYQLPQVAEAAVVGVYDEAKGEQVRAVVAFKPGQSVSEADLRAHVEANLAKYKHPADYVTVSELPKGPTGKILKREIRQQWAQWNKDLAQAAPAGAAS